VAAPKILTVDVETTPISLSGFGLFNQNFGLNQIVEPTRLLSFAAKWLHKDNVMFAAEWQKAGRQAMLDKAHRLLSEADVVVAHNAPFDVKQFNTAFWLAGMAPPAPFIVSDTLQAVRKQFFLTSNRLDFLARALDLGSKVSHEGHGLWLRVMEGDRSAQRLMRVYNEHDVVLCEQVWLALRDRGWLPGVNHAAWSGGHVCTHCQSPHVQRRGVQRTKAGLEYQRFQCQDCGGWSQSRKATGSPELRKAVNQ
jgi:hypothetical protein